MQCNWLGIVRGDGGVRACVFCGQNKREHCKIITVVSVQNLLAAQRDVLQTEIFSRTLHNICWSAIDSHDTCMLDEGEASFSACLCCHHWVARRKKSKIIFPLQALSWYVNTLRTMEGKNMDHRVVLRLCQALCAKGPLPLHIDMQAKTTSLKDHMSNKTAHNHYMFLFKSSEINLFEQIATNNIESIGWRLAQFYHTQNALTIFSPSCALVEKIRKSQSRFQEEMPKANFWSSQ